ncbi:MAG: hypothetical protein M3619_28870 [Myxococcota bacterium]|nr:hypothetical protein [Myxococcota bacterium]
MTATAIDEEVAVRHAQNLSRLAAARAAEKEARRLRREDRDEEAFAAYDRAGDLYVDTNLAFDRDDTKLADEVRRAIERCKKIAENIHNPKVKRPAATTPRPDCLACQKPLRRYKIDGRAFNDGTPQEWGDYGDGRFCGLSCGWQWACRHAPMPKKTK